MLQPFLHDLVVVVRAPLHCWFLQNGQIEPAGVQGLFCCDQRILSEAALVVEGHDLDPIAREEPGGSSAVFHSVIRTPQFGLDPLVLLRRDRRLDTAGLREDITVTSAATVAVPLTIRVWFRVASEPMEAIKAGADVHASVSVVAEGGQTFTWSWREAQTRAVLNAPGAVVDVDGDRLVATWQVDLAPRGTASFGWTIEAHDDGFPFVAAPGLVQAPATEAVRLGSLVGRALADLDALRMADRDHPEQVFFAAGAPWFLTLFGRDSLISARLALAWSPDTAVGTLRTLAARQGTTEVRQTGEQPGKILHEVRRQAMRLFGTGAEIGTGSDIVLPPVYYGTIDATCLWVILLHDVVTGGSDVLDEFLPSLRAALGWLRNSADPDGDGFVEYEDTGALNNQGWKDSRDSMRWADGALADGPIALAEVQGYAHQAALAAADLLASTGADGEADFWRSWASGLRERFRWQFWISDAIGPYPAIALDAAKRPVDGVASNMGHLLGTGILDEAEARIVTDRLMHPTMRSGYGIRTLSTTNGGYWPLGYHIGSVWPHDTALCIDGMLREGFTDEAAALAEDLLRAAWRFDYRLPELFGGQGTDETLQPHAYPAACHPQAWAAASAAVVARALS